MITKGQGSLDLYIKLHSMFVDTKAKVLLKFGSLQTMRVDRRSKKLLKFPLCVYTSYTGLCTHSRTTNFPTLCLYIMKLWIMNVDTKAKVLLKFSSLQTMRVDRRSKKLLESGTLQIHVKHAWEHVHSLTQLTFKHHYEKKVYNVLWISYYRHN